MAVRNALLILGGASAIVHVASYIMIMADLDRRGYKTNVFMSRIYFGRYLKAYLDATVKETEPPEFDSSVFGKMDREALAGLLAGRCIPWRRACRPSFFSSAGPSDSR